MFKKEGGMNEKNNEKGNNTNGEITSSSLDTTCSIGTNMKLLCRIVALWKLIKKL